MPSCGNRVPLSYARAARGVERLVYGGAIRRARLGSERIEMQAEVVAEVEAEAMEVIAEALSDNPDLVYRQQIEKWDGTLPMVSGGETSSRFVFHMGLPQE